MDMDTNLNGKIEPLELGWQLWEEGRLIHWICQEVPSPYYFYEYDCGLSGNIPTEIDNLDAIIKLRLQKNNLKGKIPQSICNLEVTHSGNYWFNLNDNICPRCSLFLEVGSHDELVSSNLSLAWIIKL